MSYKQLPIFVCDQPGCKSTVALYAAFLGWYSVTVKADDPESVMVTRGCTVGAHCHACGLGCLPSVLLLSFEKWVTFWEEIGTSSVRGEAIEMEGK